MAATATSCYFAVRSRQDWGSFVKCPSASFRGPCQACGGMTDVKLLTVDAATAGETRQNPRQRFREVLGNEPHPAVSAAGVQPYGC
jgi:hypothetical protein